MKTLMASLGICAVFCLGACGDSDGEENQCNGGGSGNTLEGSYCEDVDMIFTEVGCLTVVGSKALRIEYVRPIGTGSEKTLQIILSGDNVVLEANKEIKLTDVGAEVRRILADAAAPIRLTDELEAQSSLTFGTYTSSIGQAMDGKFAMLFKSGRNLRGEFECTLKDATPGAQ